MKVKMHNGFASAEIKKGVWLSCSLYQGAYTLSYKCESGAYIYHNDICENKKRLSTINKFAAEYGVEFVA